MSTKIAKNVFTGPNKSLTGKSESTVSTAGRPRSADASLKGLAKIAVILIATATAIEMMITTATRRHAGSTSGKYETSFKKPV